jgi:hypothetical protein
MPTTHQKSLSDKTISVEYYYKTAWGHADEFIQLYKKNHYPLLKKQIDMGRILKITMVKPRFHTAEEGRWDWRVTIVWSNIQVTNDGFSEESLSRQIYSDQETFKKEEQRRFEILLGHWDIPIVNVDLDK